MTGFYTVLLLMVSNVFMTFAWYGHLKLQEMKLIDNWPLIGVILFSWGIALFEYSFQVLVQLKVIQEVVSLTVFSLFTILVFKGQTFHWNHIAAFVCLILAVYFVFMK